jgi:hypothetical protein
MVPDSWLKMAKMPFTYAKDYLKLPVECIDFFDYSPKQNEYHLELDMQDGFNADLIKDKVLECINRFEQ